MHLKFSFGSSHALFFNIHKRSLVIGPQIIAAYFRVRGNWIFFRCHDEMEYVKSIAVNAMDEGCVG